MIENIQGMNSYFGEAGRCGTQVSTYCWGQGGKKPESFRAATSLWKHLIPFRSGVLEDLYLSVFRILYFKKRVFLTAQPAELCKIVLPRSCECANFPCYCSEIVFRFVGSIIMGIPTVEKFLCCCQLKTGVLIIGAINLVIITLADVWIIDHDGVTPMSEKNEEKWQHFFNFITKWNLIHHTCADWSSFGSFGIWDEPWRTQRCCLWGPWWPWPWGSATATGKMVMLAKLFTMILIEKPYH